jgi:alkaline phosphatase
MRLVVWPLLDVSDLFRFHIMYLQLTTSEIRPTYPDYKWLPQFLANATHSSDYLAVLLSKHISSYEGASMSDNDLRKYITETLVKGGLGIYDAEEEEIDAVVDHPTDADYIFADMISRRAQIGWSTHGHSAVDVNIYGSAGSEALIGNHENTEIGKFLREYLDVDVDAITRELRDKLKESDIAAKANLSIESFGKTSDKYHHLRQQDVF